MSTDKNALPLYNINSDQSKFKQIIRLIGLVCICACICATVYYTTDRILTHIEKESKVHPAPNVSTIILQESERVLVENTVPVEPTPTPSPAPAPAPAPTLDLSNIVRIHPRDMGVIARMSATQGGLYGQCCFEDRQCEQDRCRCLGIEPNWTMSELEVEKEMICLRENGIWQNRWSRSGSRQIDPLDQFIELVMEMCASLSSIMMMDSVLGGGSEAEVLMRESGFYKWLTPANWLPALPESNGPEHYEFRFRDFNVSDSGWSTVHALRMPKPGPFTGLNNGTHMLSLYLPYWKRRFVRMFREMPKNTHRQSCVEMMRAHTCG